MTEPDSAELERRFRPRLEADLADLAAQLERSADERGPVELDQQSVGRLSRMDAMQRQAMARAVQERLKLQKVRTEQALLRMGDGEFGYCVDCGEFIGEKRLAVDPATPKCVHCA
ncbi:TraR/DksA family transcriptional regulator [Pelagibacterium halotolerans]|uniref:DnaK suppressor protein n=1 Tax=Pelagibacterium halotolerans (strain DSM 22347 / JCM 15775 / CGMCC 1.7692 / B2) TaxID=1082931 RepID=G4RDI4_PELHB|nr:TraR/DksA C4-type zinc finger protein [Pelagibacterium halotolerans]AEQ51785.1 DnaK suppressor protein [Pelagibacterium halotolerans B2]QJR18403.1 TraR/DksA family transcriptional regulator [Pelagibacterium halotolerans]SEA23387.1 transcriptional regulator, TraR/DksA family [Pelagibacterium halotolerans]